MFGLPVQAVQLQGQVESEPRAGSSRFNLLLIGNRGVAKFLSIVRRARHHQGASGPRLDSLATTTVIRVGAITDVRAQVAGDHPGARDSVDCEGLYRGPASPPTVSK